MKREKIRYSVNEKGIAAKLSAILLFVAAALRLLGYWGFWADEDQSVVLTRILLPVMCDLLFALTMLYLGDRLFAVSFVPVVLGAAFFIINAAASGKALNVLLCAVISTAAAVLYTAAMFGKVGSKWTLVPVFAVPLIYRIFVTDRNMFLIKDPVDLREWLPELSVLCMLLAMLIAVLAMKKQVTEKTEALTDKEIDRILLENEEPVEAAGDGEEDGQAE